MPEPVAAPTPPPAPRIENVPEIGGHHPATAVVVSIARRVGYSVLQKAIDFVDAIRSPLAE